MDFSGDLYAALIMILRVSMPIVVTVTLAGVATGLIQALTQIQDQTLPHAIKLIAAALAILVFGGGLATALVIYTDQIFARIAAI